MVRYALPVAAALFMLWPASSRAQGLVPCASEGGFCRLPYPTRVIYGVPGGSTARYIRSSGVPCSNDVFGDPAPGLPKRCAFVERQDLGWRQPTPYPGEYDGEQQPAPRGHWKQNGFCPPGQHKKSNC